MVSKKFNQVFFDNNKSVNVDELFDLKPLGTKKHKDGKGRERKDPTSFRFIIQLTSLRMFLSFITNWYTIYNEILRLNYSFLPFCKDRI